jgi:recombination protein RecT
MTPERFARIALTAVNQNPDLAKCTPASFAGALLTCCQLGLEPNTPLGQAYLIPYRNYKTGAYEVQYQVGYKGLIDLAHRSGELKSIEAHVVYENDEFEFEFGLDPKLKHIPTKDAEKGNIVWVYAVYHLVNGGYGFEVMSKADIEKHRNKYSKAKNSPAWTDSWDEMAKKTVVKKALKYAPLKSEFVKAVNSDESTMETKFDDDGMDLVQANYEVEETTGEDAEVNEMEPAQQSIDADGVIENKKRYVR